MPVINFRSVSPLEGYEALPAGVYPVVIANATMKKTSTGNDMLALEYKVTSDTYTGRVIFDNLVFSENGADFVARRLLTLLLAVGYEQEELDGELEIDDELCGDLIGNEIVLTLGVTTRKDGDYAGQKQNRVNGYASISD